MSVVEGTIRAGEATRAASKACRRQTGFNWPLILLFVGAMGLTILVSALFDLAARRLGWTKEFSFVGCLVGALLSYSALIPTFRRVAIWRFRRHRRKLGLPQQVQVRARVADEAFHYDCGGLRTQVDWDVVTEIFPTNGYWVICAESNYSYVPSRFFVDQDAERAFVREFLGRVTLQARARSRAAIDFSRFD